MFLSVGLSAGLILATVMVHFQALRMTSRFLQRSKIRGEVLVLVVVLALFLAHIVEVCLYATTYYLLTVAWPVGSLEGSIGSTAMDLIYYSIVMYTSLGIGDVVPHGHVRFISSVEALNGLVLIGWSTSFTFFAMRRHWSLDRPQSDE